MIQQLRARFYLQIFIICFLSTSCSAAKIDKIKEIYAPNDIAFFDESSTKHFISEFEGKTLLLTFWATWCSPCLKELSELDILKQDFNKLPFEIVAVSEDFQGVEMVKTYFKNNDIRNLSIYYDQHNQLFNRYSITGLPTTILINQDSKMILRFTGSVEWHSEEMRSTILSYISGGYPMPRNSYSPASINLIKPTNKSSATTPSEKEGDKLESKETIHDPAPITEQSTINKPSKIE